MIGLSFLKARIRQADKDIQQLEGVLVEKGSDSIRVWLIKY